MSARFSLQPAFVILGLTIACKEAPPKVSEDTGESKNADTGCPAEPVASVQVTLVDVEGKPVVARAYDRLDVEYAVDDQGGQRTAAVCADADCTTWVAGYDIKGEIYVFSEGYVDHTLTGDGCKDWFRAHDSVEVPLADDACHVVSQTLELTLELFERDCEDTGYGGDC